MEREADVLPTLDGILILFLFLLDFCGFTSLGYNDDNSIASFRHLFVQSNLHPVQINISLCDALSECLPVFVLHHIL